MCEHKNIELEYGFCYSAGYRGLGVIHYCIDCDKVIDFDGDPECCTPEEIEHNKKTKELK